MNFLRFLAPFALLLPACTQLYQPTGDGRIPITKETEQELKEHVYMLAETIGERNHYHQAAYDRAA